MRVPFLLLGLAFLVSPAARAQHGRGPADSSSHHMAMMMERHHSVATVDLLLSYRDSLKLTDDQLKKLEDLRGHFAESGGHAMSGSGMGTGMPMMEHRMPMGQGMEMGAMMKMRQAPAHIGFDRVPGKMVPRIHPAAVKHCPMCPFGILTQGQREQAHELLGRREPHQHQG